MHLIDFSFDDYMSYAFPLDSLPFAKRLHEEGAISQKGAEIIAETLREIQVHFFEGFTKEEGRIESDLAKLRTEVLEKQQQYELAVQGVKANSAQIEQHIGGLATTEHLQKQTDLLRAENEQTRLELERFRAVTNKDITEMRKDITEMRKDIANTQRQISESEIKILRWVLGFMTAQSIAIIGSLIALVD